MFGLLLYLACVGVGTGVQVHDAVKSRKIRKAAKAQALKSDHRTSTSSGSSDSSGYTPIIDSPDFYMTFGGY